MYDILIDEEELNQSISPAIGLLRLYLEIPDVGSNLESGFDSHNNGGISQAA